jgi:hypothetical protein
MKTSRTLLVALIAPWAVGLGSALAGDLSSSPAVVRSAVDGHRYQNGGIGTDEVRAMQRQAGPYDLHLSFSEGARNAWVTDVGLAISSARGRQVFALKHAGPLTDVELPAGRYLVVAESGGVRRTGSVAVKPGAPARLNLHWPRDEG